VYAHLINTYDHTGNMAALGTLAMPKAEADNVFRYTVKCWACPDAGRL
jgi:hypothetical protein